MTHSEEVAALTPEAQIYYKDLVSRAKDSIEARELSKSIMGDLRKTPTELRMASHLAVSGLRAKFNPDHAATYNKTQLQLDTEAHEKIRSQLTSEMYSHRANGRDAEAESIQKTLSELVTPQQKAAEKQEEFDSFQSDLKATNQAKADAEFEKIRDEGIRHAVYLQRSTIDPSQTVNEQACADEWDRESSANWRRYCNHKFGVYE